MGRIIKRHLPCLDESCGSSDARNVYEDLTSFCFSCQKMFPKNAEDAVGDNDEDFAATSTVQVKSSKTSLSEIEEYPIRGFKERGITKAVCEFFKVRCTYGADGEIDAHYYPYDNGKAYKIRKLPKDFTWVNKSIGLFGKDQFSGGGKRVIVAEGEIDCLSIAQASLTRYNKIYPVVAMSSSVMTKSLLENREWLRSFSEVIIMFDEDDAGRKATEEAIKIIGLDKVKVAKLPLNDANDVLVQLGSDKIIQCTFDAAAHIPEGIITKSKLWEALVEYNNKPSVLYPECLHGINEKTKGARTGEIALFVSGTSCGKSTIMREIMLSMVDRTEEAKVGIVSLEEAPAETARKLAGMKLERNPAEEEIPLEELKVGFDAVFDNDRYMLLDHQGSLKDESILDKIEYMALSGCKYIIIDHITILVSEGTDGLTGNEAIDKVMNDLLRFVKRHDVWIGLVSHLRKTTNTGKSFEEGRMPNLDDIKGSGSIKQISFDIIAFARNLQHEDPIERNTIQMAILKCRYTGLTGPVPGAFYNYKTGRFKPLSEIPVEDFVSV